MNIKIKEDEVSINPENNIVDSIFVETERYKLSVGGITLQPENIDIFEEDSGDDDVFEHRGSFGGIIIEDKEIDLEYIIQHFITENNVTGDKNFSVCINYINMFGTNKYYIKNSVLEFESLAGEYLENAIDTMICNIGTYSTIQEILVIILDSEYSINQSDIIGVLHSYQPSVSVITSKNVGLNYPYRIFRGSVNPWNPTELLEFDDNFEEKYLDLENSCDNDFIDPNTMIETLDLEDSCDNDFIKPDTMIETSDLEYINIDNIKQKFKETNFDTCVIALCVDFDDNLYAVSEIFSALHYSTEAIYNTIINQFSHETEGLNEYNYMFTDFLFITTNNLYTALDFYNMFNFEDFTEMYKQKRDDGIFLHYFMIPDKAHAGVVADKILREAVPEWTKIDLETFNEEENYTEVANDFMEIGDESNETEIDFSDIDIKVEKTDYVETANDEDETDLLDSFIQNSILNDAKDDDAIFEGFGLRFNTIKHIEEDFSTYNKDTNLIAFACDKNNKMYIITELFNIKSHSLSEILSNNIEKVMEGHTFAEEVKKPYHFIGFLVISNNMDFDISSIADIMKKTKLPCAYEDISSDKFKIIWITTKQKSEEETVKKILLNKHPFWYEATKVIIEDEASEVNTDIKSSHNEIESYYNIPDNSSSNTEQNTDNNSIKFININNEN